MFKLTPSVKILLIVNVICWLLFNLFFENIVFVNNFVNEYLVLWPIGTPIFRPWQLLTYQFLHANFTHLFFNMFMLWMFGTEMERIWGSGKFMFTYLLSGIGAALLHMLMGMFMNDLHPIIGASGSTFGIMIGFIVLNPDRKMMIFPLFIPIRAKWLGIGYIALEVLLGFSGADGIAHFAHIGGAIVGGLITKFGNKGTLAKITNKLNSFGGEQGIENNSPYSNNSRVQKIWNNTQTFNNNTSQYNVTWEKPAQEKPKPRGVDLSNFIVGGETITQTKIDSILDKISKDGYQSLTEQEKYILTELSKRM